MVSREIKEVNRSTVKNRSLLTPSDTNHFLVHDRVITLLFEIDPRVDGFDVRVERVFVDYDEFFNENEAGCFGCDQGDSSHYRWFSSRERLLREGFIPADQPLRFERWTNYPDWQVATPRSTDMSQSASTEAGLTCRAYAMGNGMHRNQIEPLVKDAWALVLKEDDELRIFRHDVSERAVAHRLAVQLESKLSDWHIDCEYNRVVDGEPKQIILMRHVATMLAKKVKNRRSLAKKLVSASPLSVYPDIIVHRRGNRGRDNNLLVIELKKKRNPEGDRWDTEKLKELTSDAGEYQYQHGIYIEFDCNGYGRFRWFADGKEV